MIDGIYCSEDISSKNNRKWFEKSIYENFLMQNASDLDNFDLNNCISNFKLFDIVDGGSSVLSDDKYEGYSVRSLDNSEQDSYKEFAYWNLPKLGEFSHGSKYTLSFWAKGTQIKAYFHGNKGYITNKVVKSNGISIYKDKFKDGCVIFNLTSEWNRYYVTWQLNSDGDLNVIKKLLLRVMGGHQAEVCGVVFEKGDILSIYSSKTDFINNQYNNYLKENSYDIILDSGMFDKNFYLDEYDDVLSLDLDPINHYLTAGYEEGCLPNLNFDTETYVGTHDNLNGLNPFVHHILYDDNIIVRNIIGEIDKNYFSPKDFSNIMNAFEKEITIIIPIYNAYEDTKKCIESVLSNTTVKFKLILIDDKSTDVRISKLLDNYEEYPNIQIIRNSINKGFTKNVNIGLKQSKEDVILLNSDTIVTPKWVQKIIIAAYSDESIGTVTPISNASDISVPIMNVNNEIPSFLDIDSMSSLIEKVSINGNLIAPTGNGFCLFIKRKTIDDVGLFDEENFGKGYGEETDFTMRARKKNWKNVRNDSIFIYHKRSASFSLSNANKLKKSHNSILSKRYPHIGSEWNKFVNSNELCNSIESIKVNLENFDEKLTKPNLLYITTLENECPKLDDLNMLCNQFNIFVLTINQYDVSLWFVYNDKFIFITDINYEGDILSLNKYYLSLLKSLTIDLIFLRRHDPFSKIKKFPYIAPLVLASKIGIPIYHGNSSNELLNPLFKIKENKDIILNNIISENDKGVIYTAIFGNYEELLEPKFINPDLDYICFTDNPNLESEVWDIKLIDEPQLDNVRKARKIKILSHKYLKSYDYSIWVDAGFQIIGDIKKFVKQFSTGKSFMSNIHTGRDCIYDEAHACIKQKKDNSNNINNQINNYKKENFPRHFGLIETGVIYRRHNDPNLIKVMEDWFSEIIKFSNRDQLSLPYVLWKNNFSIDKYRLFYWKNQFFEHFMHQNQGVDNFNSMRIIVIEDVCEEPLTKKSINDIKYFGKNVPISIVKKSNDSNKYINEINNLVRDSNENIFVFIKSGDKIYQDLLKYIDKNYSNLMNIGAVIFNYNNYFLNEHDLRDKEFSMNDLIFNNVIFNKKALLTIGIFDDCYGENFIETAIVKLKNHDYTILKENIIGFKLNTFQKY